MCFIFRDEGEETRKGKAGEREREFFYLPCLHPQVGVEGERTPPQCGLLQGSKGEWLPGTTSWFQGEDKYLLGKGSLD